MERPITNVVFVCELENVPPGYTAIQKCPCGHSAQLWEKVLGGVTGTRYLCYTNDEQDDDQVLEDMYIPSGQQYLRKGYHIIKDTVEREEPMRHKQLAIKKVPKDQADKVVVEIIVCRSKDSISKRYIKLEKVNNCQIAYHKAQYKPSSGSDPVSQVSAAMDNIAVSPRVETDSLEPAVQVESVEPLSSAPPPPSTNLPPPQPTQGYSNPLASSFGTHQGSTSSESGATPYPPPNQPMSSSPPPVSSSYAPMTPNYPPTGQSSSSYSSSAPLPYQMTPAAPPPQMAPVGSGGYGGAAFDTNIGFSFNNAAPNPSSYNPNLPAPYNPYQHSSHPSSTGGYPPVGGGYPPAPGYPPPQGGYPAPPGGSSGYAPYPATTQGGNSSWAQPKDQRSGSGSYGFNF